MKVPSWEEFNASVLRVLHDGKTLSIRELRRQVPETMHLTEEHLAATLSSGQSTVANRIGWAVSYLTRVEALERPQRGHYRVTDRGRQLLKDNPEGVTELDLRKLARPDDLWWAPSSKRGNGVKSVDDTDEVDTSLDPIEQVDQGIARINEEVGHELLTKLQKR